MARAIFASGCFWGSQYFLAQVPGVTATTAGYTGGHTDAPTYEAVCSGVTGHAEAVEVIFDPAQVSYEALAKVFFETHDPTTMNRQGPDVGEQYRSAIFYLDEEQRAVAEALIRRLKADGLQVVTEVRPAGRFWPAEAYHQHYYRRHGGAPYCHRRVRRFDEEKA